MNLYFERLHFFLPCLLARRRILTVILISLWLSIVSPQTINIQTGTPKEGQSFQLTCLILGYTLTGDIAIAWDKDNDLIVWSQNGMFTDLDDPGDYTWEEKIISGVTHFTLFIASTSDRHNGLYKCLLANGNLMNYNIITSEIIQVNLMVNSSQTETPAVAATIPPGTIYFPDDTWPTCTSSDEFKALIYAETILRCLSTIGNPIVNLNLFVDLLRITPSSPTNVSGNFIELVHTFNVMPQHQGQHYYCQIRSAVGDQRECIFGNLQVQLFEEPVIEVIEGNDAIVNCTVGSRNTVEWMYAPQIQPSRLDDSEPGLVRITNVQNVDNGTLVTCKITDVVGKEIRDQVQIIVTPAVTFTMQTVAESVTISETSTNTIYFGTTMTTDNPKAVSNLIYIIAGAAGGTLLVILIIGIIVLCCGKQENTDDMSEDNKPTRISTGYVWDRELSKKLQESPIPSPRLSERNPHHASALQALQEKQEDQSDAMSPTLAYALTHLSDDDLDSDNDTLKKPNRKTKDSYETIGEAAASNLDRDASVHSNVYTSVSNLAPNTPAPSPPAQNEDGPTYAMPEKVRKDSKKYNAPVYATPDKTPKQNEPISIPALNPMYAVVRADPENPVVRALSQRQNGVINGAYKPDVLESGN